jgi:5-methyltetrahydropteroyltriglutamate--homocysteine methyltransferase
VRITRDLQEDRMAELHRRGDLPLLPVQSIGSSGIPAWMWLVRDAVAEGKLGPSDIEESLRDGVEIALRDMEGAGYDIVSDGEMLRADFTRNFHGRISGLEAIDYERRLGYPGPDQLDAFRAAAPLSVPDGYGMVREVEHLLTRTARPFVSALQGPVTQAFRIAPGPAYRDKGEVAWALVPFINAELKAAVVAGATLIQLDEPAFWIMPGGLPEMVAIANACLEGVDATTSLHLCFGNFRGRPATSYRSYAPFAPHFRELQLDALSLEFANRSMWETELWADHGGDKILVAGVIDVKGRDLETPDHVAGRIRQLLRWVRPERLWLSADCGFSQTARQLAVDKMRSLVEGARIVRSELEAG